MGVIICLREGGLHSSSASSSYFLIIGLTLFMIFNVWRNALPKIYWHENKLPLLDINVLYLNILDLLTNYRFSGLTHGKV